MSTKMKAEELAYGTPVEYHSGKAGAGQIFCAVFLRKHERSSGKYAEIARELGRWNNPDNGHTHIVEWVPADAIREIAQPIADERDEYREALDSAHKALDLLFARLIVAEDGFLPTQSGQPWEAMLQVHAILAKYPKP
jgi:hypothetical protein